MGTFVQRADLNMVNDGPDKAVQIWSATDHRATSILSNSAG